MTANLVLRITGEKSGESESEISLEKVWKCHCLNCKFLEIMAVGKSSTFYITEKNKWNKKRQYERDLYSIIFRAIRLITSCDQLKYYFFSSFLHKKIPYFVRKWIELFIDVYMSMKSTFPFKPESSENGKNIKIVLQKQNKTKLTSNNKNNNKRIQMFWRETTAL